MGFVAISYAFQWCKNSENRLTLDKVTESLEVGTFLRHSVVCNMSTICWKSGCLTDQQV